MLKKSQKRGINNHNHTLQLKKNIERQHKFEPELLHKNKKYSKIRYSTVRYGAVPVLMSLVKLRTVHTDVLSVCILE